jgi:hypothetical protein
MSDIYSRIVRFAICGSALSWLAAQTPEAAPVRQYPREYAFFRQSFESKNGRSNQKELDQTFIEVVKAVERIQKCAPKVTLGGMLSLVIYESAAMLAFYNTRDAENSFKERLKPEIPYWQQPFARYSYQLGIIPVHTSILRPCFRGNPPVRKLFEDGARQAGFVPTKENLLAIREEFDQVCAETAKANRVPDEPGAADYYILTSHGTFDLPKNSSGRDLKNLGKFPFFDPHVTTGIFFYSISSACRKVKSDNDAICKWGGNASVYCTAARQDDILGKWTRFTVK